MAGCRLHLALHKSTGYYWPVSSTSSFGGFRPNLAFGLFFHRLDRSQIGTAIGTAIGPSASTERAL